MKEGTVAVATFSTIPFSIASLKLLPIELVNTFLVYTYACEKSSVSFTSIPVNATKELAACLPSKTGEIVGC